MLAAPRPRTWIAAGLAALPVLQAGGCVAASVQRSDDPWLRIQAFGAGSTDSWAIAALLYLGGFLLWGWGYVYLRDYAAAVASMFFGAFYTLLAMALGRFGAVLSGYPSDFFAEYTDAQRRFDMWVSFAISLGITGITAQQVRRAYRRARGGHLR